MAIICTHCGRLNLPSSLVSSTRDDVHLCRNLPASSLRAYVADIRAEILRHKNELELLEAKERQLESELACVVYPVLTLPNEIVSLILVHCLPAHGRVRPSIRKAPLLLARICGLWREIALCTGPLRASVDIRFVSGYLRGPLGSGYRDIPNPGAVPLIKSWLGRTKGSPISPTIRSEHRKLSSDLLSLISLFAHHMQRLELSVAAVDFDHLKAACVVDFPALRELALCYSGPGTAACDPVSIFGYPSTLRQMRTLFHVHTSTSFGVYSFLTVLTFKTTSLPVVLGVLAQCPCLLHLTLDLTNVSLASLPLETLRVFDLRSLVIYGSHAYGRTAPLLTVLTLPQLRRLDLHHPPHFDTLQAFLVRSRCTLSHLGLGICTEREVTVELYIVLRMFPCLSSLRIHAGPHIEAVVHLLAEMGGTPVSLIVPQLRALVLTTSGGDRDCENLLFFLQNRRHLALHPVVLQSFHLELVENTFGGHAPFPSDSALASLADLMRDGLDITVSTRESRWPYHRMSIDRCAYFPEQRDYLENHWSAT